MYLELTVRRFRCLNPECPKKTFAERFPEWLPTYARRTTRLTDVLRRVGFEVSADSGRRILRWFAIITSGDTLLRIVKRTPIVHTSLPKVVDIDDWALRKGQRSGGIIIDQETRQDSYYTLRLFYYAPEFPERMSGRTLRSKLEPYLDYLESRFQAGCQSVSQLHREIQSQGYPGTQTLVSNWL